MTISPDVSAIAARMGAAELIGSRFGIIRKLEQTEPPPGFPPTFVQYTTHVCDSLQFSAWAADTAGAGTTTTDPDNAVVAAIGESIERYCANLVPANLRLSSYQALAEQGQDAVDPAALALFSDDQYRAPGFPFVPFTVDLPVHWAPARRITTQQAAWVPAALALITFYEGEVFADEPPILPLVHAGVAAGANRDDAEWRALAELLERDAMTLAWNGRRELCVVAPPPRLAEELDRFYGDFDIRFEPQPPGYRSLGTACRPSIEECLHESLAESLQMQLIVRYLDDPTSAFMAAAQSPDSPLQPWRPKRDYLQGLRSGWKDLTHHACHLQVHLDPASEAPFERELGPLPARTVDELNDQIDPPAASSHTALRDACVARLEAAGHPVYSVDLTTDDVRAASPIRVVRVTSPGLYSYAAAAFPCLGGARLARLLATTDYEPRLFPLPH